MPAFFNRVTFTAAILLGSVLVHVGLLGMIVLAERRALSPSEMQVIDVELVKQSELPEPPKAEPPKPEAPPEQKQPDQPQTQAAPKPPQPSAKSARAPSPEQPQAAEPPPQDKPSKPEGPSGGPPSESKGKLTPEEIASLRAQIQKCWKLPVGIPGMMGLEVVMRVSFGQKGQIVGEPMLLQAPASERGPVLVGIAMNALKDCYPFKLPPAKYPDWKVLDLKFTATGMAGLGAAPKLPKS